MILLYLLLLAKRCLTKKNSNHYFRDIAGLLQSKPAISASTSVPFPQRYHVANYGIHCFRPVPFTLFTGDLLELNRPPYTPMYIY